MIKRIVNRYAGFFLLLFILIRPEIFGDEPVKISRLSAPVEFDGIPNDSAWNDLSKFELIMFRPHFGAEPSEPSEIRIGYDKVNGLAFFNKTVMVKYIHTFTL